MDNMQRVLEGLDELVAKLQKEWNLPGISLGIVKGGDVVALKGYGYKNIAKEAAMTERTVLPIGSISKSFTALILGMLVDEGKLSWDKPVKEYIPWLKLKDPVVENRATVRDLMSHRTGLPKHDLNSVFCMKDDRKEMIEDLQYLSFNCDIRTKLQYSNQMVMLAGYVAEVLTGKTWEELVKERILEPLGMEDTNMTIQDLEASEDYSKGYLFTGTENIETAYLSLKGAGPAGSINSTAEDMAKYLKFQLGDGSWNGRQLVSKASLDEMHTVQMLGTPYLWKLDEITDANYGMGWFIDRYRGNKVVSHGGNTLGFTSLMTMLPEEDFGIIALTNANSTFLTYALSYTLLDRYLGAEEQDWTAKMNGALGEIFAAMGAAMQAKAEAKIPDANPSHPIEDYAGTYFCPGFGTLELSAADGSLSGTFNGFHALMTHYHYDIFDLTVTLMGVTVPATFVTGMSGKIDSISVVVEPTVEPVIFTKI